MLYRAPAPSVFICFFYIKKQSLSDGEKAVALRCDFSFTFVLFDLSFVLDLSRAKLKHEINKDYVNKVL